MKNILKHLKENSITNLIALASLILSIVAIVQNCTQNKAIVTIKDTPVFSYGTTDSTGSYTYHLIRLYFANNGGKSVTLMRILSDPKKKPFMGINESGESYDIIRNIQLFTANDSIKISYDLLRFQDKNNPIILEEGVLVNKIIDAGNSIQVDLVIKYCASRSPNTEKILVSLIAELSNGDTLPVQMALDAFVKAKSTR